MRFGIYLPPFGPCADPETLAGLAVDAEMSGWDGFFVWDDVASKHPIAVPDPWVALSAVAMRTSGIRLGALITPLARRRPWQVARQAVTLDHLSGGRLVLGAGLGTGATEFDNLGEQPDPKIRAAMLDEALAVVAGLWSGEDFTFEGEHYRVRNALFRPRPVQTPRIPVWVGGYWPRPAPFRRAARWDGVFPLMRGVPFTEMVPVDAIRAVKRFVDRERAELSLPTAGVDVVHAGISRGCGDATETATVDAYREAGVTWWLEHLVPDRWSTWTDWPLAEMRRRIIAGPPSKA